MTENPNPQFDPNRISQAFQSWLSDMGLLNRLEGEALTYEQKCKLFTTFLEPRFDAFIEGYPTEDRNALMSELVNAEHRLDSVFLKNMFTLHRE